MALDFEAPAAITPEQPASAPPATKPPPSTPPVSMPPRVQTDTPSPPVRLPSAVAAPANDAAKPASKPKTRATAQPSLVEPGAAPATAAPRAAAATAAHVLEGLACNGKPTYPLSAVRRGEQGTVLLRILVTPEGRAAQVTVEQSSGSATLDDAAREKVLRDCRFVPATLNGVPVAGEAWKPMTFTLTEGAAPSTAD